MKKRGFLVILVLLLVVGVEYVISAFDLNYGGTNKDLGNLGDTDSSNITLMINVSKNQVYQGDLLLVNRKFPVREEGVRSDVVQLAQEKELLKGYGLLDTKISLSKSVAQHFGMMIEDASKEGVNHFLISSGYRGFEEQEALYQEKGSDYALPAGYSEHNLGISLDIGSTQMEMSKAPEGKWLRANAWKYGFILRYPEDKTTITGIQYEPWHFRYVGLPHSAIMRENNFTLEEYLDFLKDHEHISMEVDGQLYDVTYHPVSEDTNLTVPANHKYEISGNNIDGVIVTVYK